MQWMKGLIGMFSYVTYIAVAITISLHFIYPVVQNTNPMYTMQLTGKVQQATKCTKNCPVGL